MKTSLCDCDIITERTSVPIIVEQSSCYNRLDILTCSNLNGARKRKRPLCRVKKNEVSFLLIESFLLDIRIFQSLNLSDSKKVCCG